MAYSVNKFSYSVAGGSSRNWLLFFLVIIVLGVSYGIFKYVSRGKKKSNV